MKHLSLLSYLLVLFLLTACQAGPEAAKAQPAPALNVWAAPGAVRLYPNYLGSPDVEDAELEQLRRKNSVWNRAQKQITLTGSRYETVAFQLILAINAMAVEDIEIQHSDLRGKAGTIPAEAISMFFEGQVEVNGTNYPDILAPFSAGKVHPFSIPHTVEELPIIPGQVNQGIWTDIAIPADAVAGTYTGKLDVLVKEKQYEQLDVCLEVLDSTMPAIGTPRIVLDTYGAIIKKVKFDDPEELLELEKQFYRMARDHRMFINIIRFPQSGLPRKSYLPAISRNNEGKLEIDWTSWDKRYGSYLDGSAFADGIPIEQFCLYFNIYWPAEQWPTNEWLDLSAAFPDKTAYEQAWFEYAEAWLSHLKEKGWDQPLYTIKMNHYLRPKQKYPLLWNADCPSREIDYKAVAYFADLTHRAFKNAAPLKLKFRMDPEHSHCSGAGCPHPAWEKYKAEEIMAEVDMWFYQWEHGLAHVKRLEEMKARGKDVYVYHHGWDCTNQAGIFQGLGWLLWSLDLDGYNAYNKPHKDLLQRPQKGYVNNYTMYLGWSKEGKDAFPSIRLKLQRNSLFNYELLKMAAVKDRHQASEIAANLMAWEEQPPDKEGQVFLGPEFDKNPEAFSEARSMLQRILLEQ